MGVDGPRADAGISSIADGDAAWPEGMSAVDEPPARLWLRGRAELLRPAPRVAIVGSRSPTPYGRAQAERFGAALARAGICVVSGLARGVDEAAHLAALDAGGDTIAVLGCGVDRPWPAGPAADRVRAEGLLLSEHGPGVPPRRHHFPLRNRVLAALADAVLVVEAAGRSGSLITARWAADQGQHVLAIPGRVDHPMSGGVTRLLREGATPVESPAMLLGDVYGLEAAPSSGLPSSGLPSSKGSSSSEGLYSPQDLPGGGPSESGARGGVAPAHGSSAAGRSAPGDPPAAGEDVAHRVLGALEGESLTAAEVADRCEMSLPSSLATLTWLELDGAVRRAPGGLYQRRLS